MNDLTKEAYNKLGLCLKFRLRFRKYWRECYKSLKKDWPYLILLMFVIVLCCITV